MDVGSALSTELVKGSVQVYGGYGGGDAGQQQVTLWFYYVRGSGRSRGLINELTEAALFDS